MHRNKQIAIILPDTLQSIGLQSMLTDYFPPVEISHYPTFEALSTSGNDTFDYYFTNAALFVLYADFFLPRRSKTMVLIDGTEGEVGLSATSHITIKASQEVIIEQLEQLFTGENNSISSDNNKELSTRETDVLQLIVKGQQRNCRQAEHQPEHSSQPSQEHHDQARHQNSIGTYLLCHHERHYFRRRHRTLKSLHVVIDSHSSLPFLCNRKILIVYN